MSENAMTAIIPTYGRAMSLLINAARVSPPLRDAVAVVEEYVNALDQRVHDQTHARIHAELAIEDAIAEIEKGCEWDAVAILRRALHNGS